MKKWKEIRRHLLLMMCLAMLVFGNRMTAEAATPSAGITQASGVRNQIITLDVDLEDCPDATTIGIFLEYDSSSLEFMTDKCKFTVDCMLRDFDQQKGACLWANDKAKNVNGTICELVFRIREDAVPGVSVVNAKLVVKGGEEGILDTTLRAEVAIDCEHQWDEGKVEKEATATTEGLMVYKCQKCSATKTRLLEVTGSDDSKQPADNTPNDSNDENTQNAGNSGTDNPLKPNYGSGDFDSQNNGSHNTGSQNNGPSNSGSHNSGSQNNGSQGEGSQNNGSLNTGSQNNGSQNSGSQDGSSQNTPGTTTEKEHVTGDFSYSYIQNTPGNSPAENAYLAEQRKHQLEEQMQEAERKKLEEETARLIQEQEQREKEILMDNGGEFIENFRTDQNSTSIGQIPEYTEVPSSDVGNGNQESSSIDRSEPGDASNEVVNSQNTFNQSKKPYTIIVVVVMVVVIFGVVISKSVHFGQKKGKK